MKTMKHLLHATLLAAALVGWSTTAYADDKDKTNPNAERYNVTADDGRLAFGKSYYERDGRPVGANGNFYDPAHTNWSIKNWPKSGGTADATQHLATYLHFPPCSSDAQIQLTTTGAVRFRVKVTSCEDGSEISTKEVSLPAGTQQWVSVMDKKDFAQSAWYKFDIECLEGAANVGEFFYWQFDKTAGTDRVYTADYMSSPSVHLNGWKTTDPKAPSAGLYDWVYQEVMIPEGDDIVGTYAMSLGILHGYMGIQKDSENDYPIIFSMWDNGSTDNDPNLPDYLRSGALDNEDGVTIARFGGEGTGAQAKRRTGKNWKPGQWVKFIANCRPEVVDVEVDDPDHPGQKKTITYNNTLCTAWYMAEGIDTDWQYLATIRQSGANNYFDGWYSFLEDYNWPTGQYARRSFYRNGGLHSMVDGKWYHANKVGFGHTDGGSKYGDRQDYGHGVSADYDNCFYLYSGGYHESPKDAANVLPLKQNIMPADPATLERLTARVDQAIKKEQAVKMAEDISNACETYAQSNFVVTAFSDETIENTVNTHNSVFDGNENTYWHSKWSGGEAKYPHTLTIQVQNPEEIAHISLYQSRASNYRAKTLTIYTSADGTNWTKSETVTFADANRPSADLTKPFTAKYIRLSFDEGYGGNLLCINEIYFKSSRSLDDIKAKVADILAHKDQFDGYSAQDLENLETVYAGGSATDIQTLSAALLDLAANGTPLKFGAANSVSSLSSFKAYQLHNVNGMGDAIVRDGQPTAAQCGTFPVTSDANNWLLLRSERWNAHYLYNLAAQKYLALNDGTVCLTADPTPLSVGTRSEGNTFLGFTFNLDAAAGRYLTAVGRTSLTTGANTADGALWELRDNYGLTPDANLVRQLLADIEAKGVPGFNGDGYAIRLHGSDPAVYLSTTDVKDNSNTTYSLSAYPEYFKVTASGSGFTITSAQTGKSVGYTKTTTWDVSNQPDVWYFTLSDEPTTICKAASGNNVALGPESAADKRKAGFGVFTNKDNTNLWEFEHFGSTTAPDPQPTTEYFSYKIRSKQKGTYAYINSAAVNEQGVTILGLASDRATTFTFEGTYNAGYKMSAETASGKVYVYAIDGGENKDANVGLTDNADAATVWQMKYVNSNGGRDNYNIVPVGKTLSWNVRGKVNDVATIGHWSAGNNDGSLWQIESVSSDNISLTYNFTGETYGPIEETYVLPKGSFLPHTVPYGVIANMPSGVATESGNYSTSYTMTEDYPIAIDGLYTLTVRNGKNVGLNDAENGFNVATDAAPAIFFFNGTPWGWTLYCTAQESEGQYAVGGEASEGKDALPVDILDGTPVAFILEKNNGGYAFRVKGTDNGYLNNYGGNHSARLGFWFDNAASNDPGSTFVLEPYEDFGFDFETTIGGLVYVIDGAIKGSHTLQDVYNAIDEILKRK